MFPAPFRLFRGRKTRPAVRQITFKPRLESLEDRRLLDSAGLSGAAFVTGLYRDLLHRAPEAAGLANWTGQLALTGSRPAIISGIMNSPEAQTLLINGQYQTHLGRIPDLAGQAAWHLYLAAGGSVMGLETGLLASPEFAQLAGNTKTGLVSQLYASVLHRPADPAGMAAWLQHASAMNPVQLVTAFLNTPEASEATVAGWYQIYLGRAPDGPGLASWTAGMMHSAYPTALLVGFLGSPEYALRAATPTPAFTPAATPAEAVSQFALDLYGQLEAQSGNLAFSPFSIETALAMVYAGAAGNTAQEMAAVLHLGPNTALTHDAYGAMVQQVLADGNAGGSVLEVADSLWGQEGFPISPAFLQLEQQAYGAALNPVDFIVQTEQSRATINDWVAQHTNDKIRELFSSGTITRDTRLVLANALYLNAAWNQPFDPNDTRPGSFFLSSSQPVSVPLMYQSNSFAYTEADGVQVLQMPYQGTHLAMDVLLPDQEEGLNRLEGKLTAAELASLFGKLSTQPVDVTLPSFKIDTPSFSLGTALENLGMVSAFQPYQANFSGIGNGRLNISAVLHQAYVAVGEKGTEAAAATGIALIATGGAFPPGPPVVQFNANHPFVYVVRDTSNNSILFMGRVSDPG